MENASKAIIMAGGILIGVIILTVMAIAFNKGSQFASEYDDQIEQASVAKFNSQFTKYDTTTYNEKTKRQEPVQWSWHDLISIINLAQNYNEKAGYIVVDIIIDGNSCISKNILTEQQKLDKIQYDDKKYVLIDIKYDQSSGKVSKVLFRHV